MVPKLCADGPPPRRPALDWQWPAMDAAGAEPGIGRRRRARAPSAQSCGDNSGMEPVPPGGLRDIVLLGSTGSIGTQAADIVRRNPDRFRLTALAAGGGSPGLLARQAPAFGSSGSRLSPWPARQRCRTCGQPCRRLWRPATAAALALAALPALASAPPALPVLASAPPAPAAGEDRAAVRALARVAGPGSARAAGLVLASGRCPR